MVVKRLTRKEREKIIEKHFGKIPKGKFKSGIYSYCDRWCEKCNKKDACFLFYMEEREKAGSLAKGMNPQSNEAVFDRIERSLEKTKNLILEITKAEGIDLTMTPEQEKEYKRERRLTDPSRHLLMRLTRRLFKETYYFIESIPPIESKKLEEEGEKIAHYSTQVAAKVFSALSAKLHAKYEKKNRKFWLDDAFKTSCVAYRSAKICRDALKRLDFHLSNFQIRSLVNNYEQILLEIDKKLLSELHPNG